MSLLVEICEAIDLETGKEAPKVSNYIIQNRYFIKDQGLTRSNRPICK